MRKIDTNISVVIPVYNSEKTLDELIFRIKNALSEFARYNIIMVNDGSTDNSFRKITELSALDKNILGISLKKNSGQQCAILCGLRYAQGDFTVIIDDDLEQSPENIKHLYDEIIKGYDAVYAIQKKRGMHRNLGSVMRDILLNLMTDKPKKQKVSSFRIINRETREKVVRANTEFVYISMEILKYTNKISNINTEQGRYAPSNYTLFSLIRLYKNIIRTYGKAKIFCRYKTQGDCYDIREFAGGGKA